VEKFHAAPDETDAAHGLVACHGVTGGGVVIGHRAAEERGKRAGEKLRDGSH